MTTPMTLRRRIAVFATCAAIAPFAVAQDKYPSKPIKFVVPFAAGGENDVIARLVANKVTAMQGYTIIVENRPGAGGNMGAEAALREPPDGYTFLVVSGAYAGNAVVSKPSFDPIAAIQPVVQFTSMPSGVVVAGNSPYKSMGQLLDTARKAPGKVTYGSGGVGSLSNLSMEFFAYLTGVKLTHIPYKGNSGAIADLVGGQVDLMAGGVTTVRPYLKGGQARLLAVTGTARLAEMPDVPTFTELGLGRFDAELWHGLVASKNVPPALITKMNVAINDALVSPELKKTFAEQGVRPVGGTPEHFKQVIRGDMDRWQKIVKEAGLKAS